ncbi:tol [Fusarium beomiforme]|uniref:Tol n=1 Tax=Fusarium beomiforme TaxID=44412 RepID=A0A9P5DZ22_9HYPO|nr:tol [Fusarium beomiforme]
MSSGSPVVYHYLAIGKLGRGEVLKLFLKDAGIDFEEKRYTYPDTWPETSKKLKEQGITRTGTLPSLEYKGQILIQHIPILRYLSRDLGKYDGKTNEDKYLVDAVADIYIDWRFQWVASLKGPTVEYKEEFLPKYYDLIGQYYSDREGPYLLGNEISYTDFAIYQSIDNDTRTKTLPSKIPDVLLKLKEAIEARPNIAEYIKSEIQPFGATALSATLMLAAPLSLPADIQPYYEMSEDAPNLCSVCAAINFEKLFFPDPKPINASYRPPPDPCLGTLQEILDRAETCNVCKLIIDTHRQRYIRAPYGCSPNHPDFINPVPGAEPEVHEEVKKYGLRLTVNEEPIKCFLEARDFLSNHAYMYSEDGPDLQAGGVNRVALRLEPPPWLAILASSITLQAAWPAGVPESQTIRDGLTVEGTGRMIGPQLDFSIPRHWIKQCEVEHGEKCRKPKWLSDSDTDWPERCRVIDIKERRIVGLLPTMRYVALSYVWGSSEEAKEFRLKRRLTRENLFRLQRPDSLDELHIPKTIQDAMYVTEQVGERFLWVDALCIVQDDPTDLGHQTARMDLIYSRALFTILAACGEDSDSGLVGLPGHSRDVFQRQVRVSSAGLHVMPLVTLSEEDTLPFSRWQTRGWTFQERLLSRRSLIFTNKQVYWCCDGTTWEEESILDIPGSTANSNSHAFGCYDEWDDNVAKFSLDGFDSYITQFSERKFSYPSDVLPAFLGIIRRFEHLNGEKIHWGLNARTFDQALTWKYGRDRRLERYTSTSEDSVYSVPYPSWSWLGWTGFIGASSSLRVGEDYDRRGLGDARSLLAFYSLMSDGSVFLIKGTSSKAVNDFGKEVISEAEKSSHEWIGDSTVTGPIHISDVLLASELESLQIDGSQQVSTPYDTGRIVFWTSHANISIQISNRDGIHMETSDGLVKLDLKLAWPFMNNFYDHFQDALDKENDAKMSRLKSFLKRKTVLDRRTISLVVISRHYGFYEAEDEIVKLNVMAVEERVPGSGVWGRIGLGVMKEEEWVKLDIDWRMTRYQVMADTSIIDSDQQLSLRVAQTPSYCRLCNIELRGLQTWKGHVKSDGHVHKLQEKVHGAVASSTATRSPRSPSSRRRKRSDLDISFNQKDEDSESDGDIESQDLEEDSNEFIAPEFNPSQCLFCNKDSSNLDNSLKHMSTAHGFNVPFQDFLSVDVETLISYFHFVIHSYHECICCGIRRSTVEGIRHHMLAKGHCRFDISPETEEFYRIPQYEDVLGDRRQDAHDPVRLPSGRVISHRQHEEPHPARQIPSDQKRLDSSTLLSPANEAILAAQLSRLKVTSDRAAQREEKRWRGRLERANNFFALKRFRLDAADSRMGRQF